MTTTTLTRANFESTIVDNPIPTVVAFRDGVLVYSQPGAIPAAVLEDLINQVKALDMDEVRAKISARKAAATA